MTTLLIALKEAKTIAEVVGTAKYLRRDETYPQITVKDLGEEFVGDEGIELAFNDVQEKGLPEVTSLLDAIIVSFPEGLTSEEIQTRLQAKQSRIIAVMAALGMKTCPSFNIDDALKIWSIFSHGTEIDVEWFNEYMSHVAPMIEVPSLSPEGIRAATTYVDDREREVHHLFCNRFMYDSVDELDIKEWELLVSDDLRDAFQAQLVMAGITSPVRTLKLDRLKEFYQL